MAKITAFIFSAVLFVSVCLGQTAPSAYTPRYQFSEWSTGANPGATGLNNNWLKIDTAIFQGVSGIKRTLDSVTTPYTPYQFLVTNDSLKLWYNRTISGDRFSGTLRARSLGRSESNIYAGIEAVSKGNDSVLTSVYARANDTVDVTGTLKFNRLSGISNTKSTTYSSVYFTDTTSIASGRPQGFYWSQISNDTRPPAFVFRKSRGTTDSPTAIQNGDFFLNFTGQGYNGSSYQSAGVFRFAAVGNWDATHRGSFFEVVVTDSAASASTATALRINHLGNVGIKNTSPTAKLHIAAGTATANTAPLKFTDQAALLTTPEAGAVEMKGDSLYFTRASGTRVALAQGGGGGGSGGVAGGWVRTTSIRTDTAGVKVYILTDLADTANYGAMLNVTGTSKFAGTVDHTADITLRDTTILQATGRKLLNVNYEGEPIVDTYLAKITTVDKVSGSAIFSGTIGGTTSINISGNIATSAGTISTGGNILLNSKYLSNDGGNEGVSVDNSGNVTLSGTANNVGTITTGVWNAGAVTATAVTSTGNIGTSTGTVTGHNVFAYNLLLSDLGGDHEGSIVFTRPSTGITLTLSASSTASSNKAISFPNATGTVITTGNLTDISSLSLESGLTVGSSGEAPVVNFSTGGINVTSITASPSGGHEITLPNTTGTMALTSDLPSAFGSKTTPGGAKGWWLVDSDNTVVQRVYTRTLTDKNAVTVTVLTTD